MTAEINHPSIKVVMMTLDKEADQVLEIDKDKWVPYNI
jgi:hypothetical protein